MVTLAATAAVQTVRYQFREGFKGQFPLVVCCWGIVPHGLMWAIAGLGPDCATKEDPSSGWAWRDGWQCAR